MDPVTTLSRTGELMLPLMRLAMRCGKRGKCKGTYSPGLDVACGSSIRAASL